jgi:hypothetical protein
MDCARNPTNPLTIKAFAERPEEQENLLAQGGAVALDLKANIVASFIGIPTETALSFETLEVPGLVQLTIAPINAWSIDTLHDVSENSVGKFERGVVKCKKETETDTPPGSATETYTPSEGPIPATVSPTGITPGELGPSVPIQGSVTWIRDINEDNNGVHTVGHRQLTISFSGSWDPAFPLMKNTSGSWNASMKETKDSHCSSVTTTATGGGGLTQDGLTSSFAVLRAWNSGFAESPNECDFEVLN